MTPALSAHSKAQSQATAQNSVPEPDDYDAILAAVSETPRGRWFLAEYARRNRSADTDAVLGEIGRLEALIALADPRVSEQRAHGALHDLATVMALTATGTDASSEGLTPDVVAQLALGVGQSGENIRETLLTVRGAVAALREAGGDPVRAARFAGALDRHLGLIDDAAGAVVQSALRIEALAQVIGQMRARLRILLQSQGTAAKPETKPQPPLPAPAARPAILPPEPANRPEPVPQDPPPFEQVWEVPAAPAHARLRHVASLMQEAEPAEDDILSHDTPLQSLARSARTAHAGRSLAELDRLSYAERAALFA